MKIPCSNCNQRLEIPEELAGQTIECPACNASLAVPAITAPPPAPAQVQEGAPQAASSKKSKSPILKWAIASVAGVAVVVVVLIMFFPEMVVKTPKELPDSRNPWIQKTVTGQGTQQPTPPPEAKPEPQTVKAPDISIHDAALGGDIEAIKQHIAAGTDVNAKDGLGQTPLGWAKDTNNKEIADLLRNHGGKTSEELKSGKPKFYYDMAAVYGESVYWPDTSNARILKDNYSDLNNAQFIDKLYELMGDSEGQIHAFVLIYSDRTQRKINYAVAKAFNHPYDKSTSSTGQQVYTTATYLSEAKSFSTLVPTQVE